MQAEPQMHSTVEFSEEFSFSPVWCTTWCTPVSAAFWVDCGSPVSRSVDSQPTFPQAVWQHFDGALEGVWSNEMTHNELFTATHVPFGSLGHWAPKAGHWLQHSFFDPG
eukprot:TRINITY_DN67740_c1_g1_i2.p3 TRINITY_DN67740_c1_g1~~TRINITY_DN67740_c1_g1_i2.p3  ORF type:complete len:109 (-),score=5.63 TRINITY_DN67740_c1_g1_i2:919-1245(-)